MGVRQQIEDAVFLYHQGRYEGCLSVLLLAIGASSRKVFPRPAQDTYSFPRFLGSRLSNIMFGSRAADGACDSGIIVNFRDKESLLEEVLYKYYRCELIHEGDLPDDVLFLPDQGMPDPSGSITLKIKYGSKLVLDNAWLNVLIKSVTHAECNGSEFGIQHFRLFPANGEDFKELTEQIAQAYDTTIGRINIMQDIVHELRTIPISNIDDDSLRLAFDQIVADGTINAGAISGLTSKGSYRNLIDFSDPRNLEALTVGFTGRDNRLTDLGIDLLRYVSSRFFSKQVGQ